MAKSRTHWIEDPATIAALASPVRQNILDRIEAHGPSSVKNLAASLEMAPDALYYHVKTLVRVGLLVASGTQKTSRRNEAVYDIVKRNWHIAYEPDDPDNRSAVRSVTTEILRQAERDFTAGIEQDNVVTRGGRRNLWSLRLEANLTRSDVEAINRHLQAIVDILRKPKRDGKGRLHALSWVFAPIPEPRRRQERSHKQRRAGPDSEGKSSS